MSRSSANARSSRRRAGRALCSTHWLVIAAALGCSPLPRRSSEPTAPGAAPAASSSSVAHDPWHERERGQWPDPGQYVRFEPGAGRFNLVHAGAAAPLVASRNDTPGVLRALGDLRADITRVSRVEPALELERVPAAKQVVVVGTLGKSPLVDELVARGKLDVSAVRGRWETSVVAVVEAPWSGVERALVIAGSDQRGTIFGIYDVSKQIGVSPWYYWDDVPARPRDGLYVMPGAHSRGEPAVKYRGFFINDEDPALGTWARNTFGPGPNPKHPHGFDHRLYAKVFEVLLRLKGNYLWPAVWGRSLFDDDPRSQALAAEYGIVLGTSHEAPMMRAQDEWNRYGQSDGPYGGTGQFSFVKNAEAIEKYWADGIRRMGEHESIVTVGMRGNGDEGMEDAAGIELMQRIVTEQRELLGELTGKDVTTVPQVWTLYKEVQDYWDQGMRGPDDVTIIWCDDNWGNMRALPRPGEPPRRGGYGLYYHFDYVGGGRNYKWNDTTPLVNVWEQLHLSYAYGVDRIWMVNVGDLKNDEHPLEFFMDYAWSPERWPLERLHDWEVAWATAQFGPEHADAIASLLTRYGQLQSRRKPELTNRLISLDPNLDVSRDDKAVVYTDGSPFSLVNYREAERATAEWRALAQESDRIAAALDATLRDAYYQLAHYPVKSTANMYELRLAQFENLLYAAQGRKAALERADRAEARFKDDAALSEYYNETLAGGKWRGFQTQAKFGYGGPYPNSSWQQPPNRGPGPSDFIWPALARPTIPAEGALGVAIDGSEKAWPGESSDPVLPTFSPFQTQPEQYIDVFNRGQRPFRYTVEPGVPWLMASPSSGSVDAEARVSLRVDYGRAPEGTTRVPIRVTGPKGAAVTVQAVVEKPRVARESLRGFIEANGYVSIEAEHFDRSTRKDGAYWQLLPGIGRTAGGMTLFPVTAPRLEPGGDTPRLEYDVHLFTPGRVVVWAYLSPRNDALHGNGLEYAVSLDDAPPQVVNVTTALQGIPMNRSWERNTSDNVNRTSTEHHVKAPGHHVLKVWAVDPSVIVQKLVIDTGGLKTSHLGPPESLRLPSRQASRAQ